MAWLLLLWALGVTSMGTEVGAAGGAWLAAGGAWLAASKEALIPAAETGTTTPSEEDLFEALGATGATSSRVGMGAVSWLEAWAVRDST